ncbi:MAG: HAMP domain-containing histidine kinase [Planctomycetes bacterium]|nr:HAMP domain-containing histidine kinase [Planctomycetota bacterium]
METPSEPRAADQRATIAAYERLIVEMTELAGGLAHELRNPLSTVMINLKLLEEDLRSPEGHPDDIRRRALLKVASLRREAERLQSLFDDFLRLMGPCRPKLAAVDVVAAVRRLAEFVAPLAHGKNVSLRFDAPAAPVPCLADERLLEQALLNLILNAQDAMPGGGTITLSVAADACGVAVQVSDTGVGIAPEAHGQVFRPFFSTKATGTGLGLSISQRIVQAHGGSLTFLSEPGRGTTFTLRLPVPAATAPTVEPPPTEERGANRSDS